MYMWKAALVTVAFAGIAPALAVDAGTPDLAALQARIPDTSIQSLYNECTGKDLHDQFFCVGYISATLDAVGMLAAAESQPQSFRMCPKVPVTPGAAVQAFKNWAQKHPQSWTLDRVYGVRWALHDAWPCP